MRALEEVGVRTCSALGINAARVAGHTGLWSEGAKIAAVGVRATRWVTMHGLSLNVDPDLQNYDHIVPCGITGEHAAIGALSQQQPGLSTADVVPHLCRAFEDVFELELSLHTVAKNPNRELPHPMVPIA